MKYELWQQDPVPTWGVEAHPSEAFDWLAEPFVNLIRANKGGVTMRGVDIGRLPTILSTGIDVDPPDGVIYCEVGDKAYEYGGFPKVIMVLRYENDAGKQVTFPACRTVLSDSSPESVAKARELYPFDLERDSEGREHRCRVQPASHAELSYLSAYGYFVDGNPWDALAAVFVFGTREHLHAARSVVEALRTRSVTAPLP